MPPPQPIFSRETFAEANSREEEKSADQETLDEKYDYDSYQKGYEEVETLHSEGTAYSGSSYLSDDASPETTDYFELQLMVILCTTLTMDTYQIEKTITKRKVRLVGGKAGNLVLENPVPTELRKVLTRTESPFGEFTNMTYTACTSQPDTFSAEGFTLRAAKYGRETEIVICITMYNEDEVAFARTMHGVMKNIAHLCSRHKSKIWGKDSWKKFK